MKLFSQSCQTFRLIAEPKPSHIRAALAQDPLLNVEINNGKPNQVNSQHYCTEQDVCKQLGVGHVGHQVFGSENNQAHQQCRGCEQLSHKDECVAM